MVNESTLGASKDSGYGETQPNRLWLVIIGVGFAILGLVGLGMTFAVTAVSIMFFGIMLVVGAGAEFVDAARRKGFKSIMYPVLTGILYLFAGVTIIRNPIQAELILTLVMAGVMLLVGLTRVVMALGMRKSGSWVLHFISGIVSAILGMMILIQWPVSGLWVIGLVVSVELLVNGWSYIFLGMSSKQA